MTFDEYHVKSRETAQYPNLGSNLLYPALGLAGEAGETVDKIKKWWRNFGITSPDMLDEKMKEAVNQIP
jgi:hypothetical protein